MFVCRNWTELTDWQRLLWLSEALYQGGIFKKNDVLSRGKGAKSISF